MFSSLEFLDIYDEFSSLSDRKILASINQAALFCPQDVWKTNHKNAVYLLTAHILAMNLEQIGSIAASAVQNAKGTKSSMNLNNDSWLCGSVWGQQFKELKNTLPVMGFVP